MEHAGTVHGTHDDMLQEIEVLCSSIRPLLPTLPGIPLRDIRAVDLRYGYNVCLGGAETVNGVPYGLATACVVLRQELPYAASDAVAHIRIIEPYGCAGSECVLEHRFWAYTRDGEWIAVTATSSRWYEHGSGHELPPEVVRCLNVQIRRVSLEELLTLGWVNAADIQIAFRKAVGCREQRTSR